MGNVALERRWKLFSKPFRSASQTDNPKRQIPMGRTRCLEDKEDYFGKKVPFMGCKTLTAQGDLFFTPPKIPVNTQEILSKRDPLLLTGEFFHHLSNHLHVDLYCYGEMSPHVWVE